MLGQRELNDPTGWDGDSAVASGWDDMSSAAPGGDGESSMAPGCRESVGSGRDRQTRRLPTEVEGAWRFQAGTEEA